MGESRSNSHMSQNTRGLSITKKKSDLSITPSRTNYEPNDQDENSPEFRSPFMNDLEDKPIDQDSQIESP